MDQTRKLAMVAGFIPQLGVRGKRRNWRTSASAANPSITSLDDTPSASAKFLKISSVFRLDSKVPPCID